MKIVLSALVAALKSLFHPRMLALILWPMLASLVIWVGLSFFFWSNWINQLAALVQLTSAEQWVAQGVLAIISHYLITVILVMLLIPLIYITALMATAVFVMPMMVNHVAQKNFPQLERKLGGSTSGSVLNSIWAIVVYCTGWILTLPLWLFSPFAIILPILLLAYLNQRLFRYDALADHASKEEFELLMERSTGKLYLLGAMLGLLQFIPVLNLLSPIYIGLAYIHLCLSELSALRNVAANKGVLADPAASQFLS